MPARRQDHEQEWDNLLDAMAESVFTATDEEILEEVRDEGRNPDQAAFAFESLLLDTVKSHFRAERQRLEQEEPEIPLAARGRIPALPADRRSLLEKVLQLLPNLKSGLVTAHHREFTEFSDSDVESALETFDDLGILDQVLEPEHDPD